MEAGSARKVALIGWISKWNQDSEPASLMIPDPPTQAEVQALRGGCEELADDVRALSAVVHALRGALACDGNGLVKLQGHGLRSTLQRRRGRRYSKCVESSSVSLPLSIRIRASGTDLS